MSFSITIIGLGPGQWDDLTIQAHTIIAQAVANGQTVYFRTLIHPTVEPLQREIPDLHIESFDSLYDESENWETLYQQIATEVCTQAERQAVIYAVPGHPLIGESSVQRLLAMARERGLSTRIVAGLSFLEPVCTLLELDPLEAGAQIVDATMLAALNADEVAGKLIPTTPLLVTQVYNRRVASAVKIALSECYPDEWPVKLVRAAGVENDEEVLEMPLYALDRNTRPDHLSTLYVPPLDQLTSLRLPETLRFITMRLRRDPDGCPWDREQTHHSLTRYLLEETYEAVQALENNDMENLSEELGDLLLQVYLHSEIARQNGEFSIGDVFEHVTAKLIRRHPHVFGEASVSSADQVVQNWEAIKQQERADSGKNVQQASIFDGAPLAAPSLTIAQEYQKRTAKIGFEFVNAHDMWQKVQEELREIQEAVTPEHQLEELGDLLFIIAKAARWLHIDAEEALRRANAKFRQRFQRMEAVIRAEGRSNTSYNSSEWAALWNKAKVQ